MNILSSVCKHQGQIHFNFTGSSLASTVAVANLCGIHKLKEMSNSNIDAITKCKVQKEEKNDRTAEVI